jgi:ketosteroid isomerase-like protein
VAPTAFRAEIDQLRSDYEKSVAAGDFKAMSRLLADGAVMVRPGGPGWDAMAAAASGAPGAESNHRHADFQSAALSLELPRLQPFLVELCEHSRSREK